MNFNITVLVSGSGWPITNQLQNYKFFLIAAILFLKKSHGFYGGYSLDGVGDT